MERSDEEMEPGRWGRDGGRWSMSAEDFDALVDEVEAAQGPRPWRPADPFAALVRDAIDELPAWVRAELDRDVAVVIADDGDSPRNYNVVHADRIYGLYVGSGTGNSPRDGARIVLFRDTLQRDFPDPDDLREQVVTTLRHEVAHHFGADEEHVRILGL